MLLIDVDHFKQINDRVGHAAGDVVLREAGARIRAALRSYESAYRIGGEEVLILLPHADVEAATEVAERLRERRWRLALRRAGGHRLGRRRRDGAGRAVRLRGRFPASRRGAL